MILTKDGSRFYWNGRIVDLYIDWCGVDTRIEHAPYDDEEGGAVPDEELDELTKQAHRYGVFLEGKHR